MTTFLLTRHAACDPLGRFLAGRAPGVHLNAEGRAQADALAARLDAIALDAVYASPLERALETAAPLAARRQLDVEVVDALGELAFGDWTGRSLASLDGDPEWRRYNTMRSVARIPGGETMLEVQARAVAALETLRRARPDGRCVVVSHGDVIRSLVAHFAGIPLDLMLRLEIAPASVSVLHLTDDWISLGAINHTADLAL